MAPKFAMGPSMENKKPFVKQDGSPITPRGGYSSKGTWYPGPGIRSLLARSFILQVVWQLMAVMSTAYREGTVILFGLLKPLKRPTSSDEREKRTHVSAEVSPFAYKRLRHSSLIPA